jgi:S-(hydroxymethyl)glutathione dehydrogenase/alcohol dehydrogenase
MKAAVLTMRNSPLQIQDVQVDEPQAGEVLVKVAANGLCHSDLHAIDGSLGRPLPPAILGHEVSGTVVAVGPGVEEFSEGQHVVGCLSAACGICARCIAGERWLCRARVRTHRAAGGRPRRSIDGRPIEAHCELGGLAEYVLTHHSQLVAIAEAMPLEIAAILGCAVVTGFGAVTRSAQVRPGETVVVIGCGGVGLNVVHAAHLSGASIVVAIDRNPDALALADSLGATRGVLAAEQDANHVVQEVTGGQGADHVFEVVGSPALTRQAVGMTRVGGTTYILGVSPTGVDLAIPAYDIWFLGKTVKGVVMGSNNFKVDIPRYVELYLQGRVHLDTMITDRVPLDAVNGSYELLRTGKPGRTVVVF